MNPECQSLLAVFARCFPNAHITLVASAHDYSVSLFIADEGITHFIIVNRAHFSSVQQLADFIEEAHFVDLMALSPVAVRLAIADEAGHLNCISRTMAHA